MIERKHINKRFTIRHNKEVWDARVVEWEGELYVRYESGKDKGFLISTRYFIWGDYCEWEQPQSALSRAVAIHQANQDLSLSFEDLTDYFWRRSPSESLYYSHSSDDITSGAGFTLDLLYKVDEDDNYVRFYVSTEYSEKYEVVFDKRKRIEVE